MSVLAADSTFSDVKTFDWFYNDVRYVCEKGLMNGTSSNTFSPKATTTRGMIVTILYRMAGESAVTGACSFEDVPAGAYYEKPVIWAAENEIVSGYSANTFDPDGAITREQLAAILYRYAKFCSYDVTASAEINKFSDAGVVSSYALTAMKWASAEGLINGSGSKLDPQGSATRAQVAAILTRFCKRFVDKTGDTKAPATSTGTGWHPTPTPDPEPDNTYTVTFDSNGGGTVDSQQVKAGNYAKRPMVAERTGYLLAGWFENNNESDWTNTFKFGTTPITKDITLHAIWVDITTDTDGDGLSDELETYIGTNTNLADTDGDGLTDYQEVVELGTDPLKKDTNSNGINDFDEDYDGDGVSNGQEFQKGTDPMLSDTDNDGLSDYDELFVYHTEATNEDSDADGASDGWEIENGFDPLVFNSTFTITKLPEEPSDELPVSAGAVVSVTGNQVEHFEINPVSVVDDPLLSSSIAGYLGQAYEFDANGAISSATLTFKYDTSLGTIGVDFQPRIFYYNEDNGTFEELENQTVVDGQVSAHVGHFSTYILLNKVEFDRVWENEIKAPIVDGQGSASGIDVVFAIDVSGSMSNYSRLSTAKSALNTFLNALSDKDRAALVKFSSSATILTDLTDDIDSVKSYVSELSAYGQTSMYKGFNNALDLLTDSEKTYGYKMIIILSDGIDEPSTSYSGYYANLVQRAKDNGVVVYTVGAGTSVDTSVLTQIATNTGGSYYAATATSEITDAFAEIQGDTVDLTTDSNNDGIPDYFNDLIYAGTLVLSNGSNEFCGIDFNYDANGNPSADWDGDGVKNGEELIVTYDAKTNRVYMTMKSNPLYVHSDGDGISDYDEIQNGTNPLITYQASKNAVDNLSQDDYYYYETSVESYDDDWLFKADTAFLAAIYGIWNKSELYRDIMIDYFKNYGEATYLKNAEAQALKKSMIESLIDVISKINGAYKKYWKDPTGEIANIRKLIDTINGTTKPESIKYLFVEQYSEVLEEIYVINPEVGTITVSSYSVSEYSAKLINLTELSQKINTGIRVAGYGLDFADTILALASISANSESFERNVDILKTIAEDSTDKNAVKAANTVMNRLGQEYGKAWLSAIGGDVLEALGKEAKRLALKKLAAANPYVLAIEVVVDGIDILTGISDDLKQQFKMITYERMTEAVTDLLSDMIKSGDNYYYVAEEHTDSFKRLLINLAQIRILGEKMYCDWQEDGGIIGWFDDNDDVEEKIDKQIVFVKNNVDRLHLEITPTLLVLYHSTK